MKRAIMALFVIAMPAATSAQGIPVFDATAFTKDIETLQQHVMDFQKQVEQLEQMKQQYEAQIKQLTNLEGILGSMTGINDIANLFNSVKDIAARAEKIADLSDFSRAIRLGSEIDIAALFKNNGTVGAKWNAYQVNETLKATGLSIERLGQMTASGRPEQQAVASQAAANATAIAAADIAYDEARSSLERVDGLVDAIGGQGTIKESVDLNTRMAAEVAYMMGQMWRLNAANAMATGQNGVNLAAEIARQQAFFDFGGN